MNQSAQFPADCNKVCHLNQLVRGIGEARPQPVIPTRPILLWAPSCARKATSRWPRAPKAGAGSG